MDGTVAMVLSLVFGVACGVVAAAIWRWDRLRLIGRYEQRRLAGEAESDRLRLRIAGLEGAEERTGELAEELSRVREVAARAPELEHELGRRREEVERLQGLEEEVVELRPRAEQADELELQVSTLTAQLQRLAGLDAEIEEIRAGADVAEGLLQRLTELESQLSEARAGAQRQVETEELLAQSRLEIHRLGGRLDTHLEGRRRAARELLAVTAMASKAEQAAAAAEARARAAEALVVRRDETILALEKWLARPVAPLPGSNGSPKSGEPSTMPPATGRAGEAVKDEEKQERELAVKNEEKAAKAARKAEKAAARKAEKKAARKAARKAEKAAARKAEKKAARKAEKAAARKAEKKTARKAEKAAARRAEKKAARKAEKAAARKADEAAGEPVPKAEKAVEAIGPEAVAPDRDDLQAISGIGPVLERTLNGLGIVTWEQLAALDEDEVARLSQRLPGVPGRIARDGWVAQAAGLVEQNPRPDHRGMRSISGAPQRGG